MTRACGNRVAGGVYLEAGLGPRGHPVDEFICDPPRPVDENALGMSARGMSYIEFADRTWVFDHVGRDYPNAADIIEEGKQQGFSRRIQSTFDFSRLEPSTRLALVHPRAIPSHWELLKQHEPKTRNVPPKMTTQYGCPQLIGYEHCGKPMEGHDNPHQVGGQLMCARLWWQDLDPDSTKPVDINETDQSRWREKRLGDTRYYAMARPRAIKNPTWQTGIILTLPIHQIVVVRDHEGKTHRKALERLDAARLPVELVDE